MTAHRPLCCFVRKGAGVLPFGQKTDQKQKRAQESFGLYIHIHVQGIDLDIHKQTLERLVVHRQK